jgi:hypothetical protein
VFRPPSPVKAADTLQTGRSHACARQLNTTVCVRLGYHSMHEISVLLRCVALASWRASTRAEHRHSRSVDSRSRARDYPDARIRVQPRAYACMSTAAAGRAAGHHQSTTPTVVKAFAWSAAVRADHIPRIRHPSRIPAPFGRGIDESLLAPLAVPRTACARVPIGFDILPAAAVAASLLACVACIQVNKGAGSRTAPPVVYVQRFNGGPGCRIREIKRCHLSRDAV